MKSFGKIFLRGLLAVLPVALTIWFLWWLGSMAERTLGGLLQLVLPEAYYLPGLGILAGASVVFLVGLFAHAWIVRATARIAERRLEQVPLVKTIYGSVRDFVAFFRQDEREDRLGRPVLLELGGAQLVGFVTGEDAVALGLEGHVVVYLPMGYQLGGYTVAVPADSVRPIKTLNTQEAMRYALTAGISGRTPAKQ
ncbi:MAG TPA: DUF502 domain-containing protein [Planctomycetota bacterium]